MILFLVCCCLYVSEIICLRDVIILMPEAVKENEKVRMVCKYNLEGEKLYTLKWFKSLEYEFFRYTPKLTPDTNVFMTESHPDLDVVKEESYGEQVTIRKATRGLAGQYTCEVTTEMPSLHTDSAQAELKVAVLPNPDELPKIKNQDKSRVKQGEWVKLTCVSPRSIPAANLSWTINRIPMNMTDHEIFQFSKRILSGNDLEESISNFSFLVTDKLLLGNNHYLKVRCIANIYSLDQKSWEITLLLDKPQKAIFSPETRANPYYIDNKISAYDVKKQHTKMTNKISDIRDDGSAMTKISILIVSTMALSIQFL